ncbi:MAG TPA: hypothetical protein VGK32_16295 [Vicinamibacterales bacterium]|jgi:hypothetical protein
MMMSSVPSRSRPVTTGAAQLQLEALELLPCGCVIAIQRVRLSGVSVMSLEAKGPHCTYQQHRLNKVIRLGESLDLLDYDEEDNRSI